MAETRKPRRLVVQKDPEVPESDTVLAKAIIKLSSEVGKILASGLNRRAVVVLLHDITGVGKPDIRKILEGMEQLKSDYCS